MSLSSINIRKQVQSLQKSPIEPGGLCAVAFGKIEDVQDWPEIDPETGIMNTAINMKPGKIIFLCEAPSKGRSLFWETKEHEAGDTMEFTVLARMGGTNTENILSLVAAAHSKFFVIGKDRQGFQHLVGWKNAGATLKHKYDTADSTGSRMVDLRWSWSSAPRSTLYQAQSFQITIGGVLVTAGYLKAIDSFIAGTPGAPMNAGDEVYTNALMAGKKILVLASGSALPLEDGSNVIEWDDPVTGASTRHYTKILADDFLTIHGGVTQYEPIHIYEIN